MKKILIVANITLLTLIAGLAVDLFYSMIDYHFQAISAPQETLTDVPSFSDASRKQNISLAHYQPIIGRDLFQIGDRQNTLPPTPDPTKDLEITDLKIKLWGTVTGNGAMKYAVIEAKGENQRLEQALYREGDTVETATIEQILDDTIILSHDGQRQVLQMEQFLQGAGGRRSARRTATASGRRQPRTYKRSISRNMIDNAAQNFNQLISEANIVPDANGMKISRIKPSSLFRRLGLRNGDVITSVNNSQIRSVDDAMGIYKDLQNGGGISIDLLRRGRPTTIEYTVR